MPDLASHPLRRFLSHGLLATINTDDPVISGIDADHMSTRWRRPGPACRAPQIRQAQKNALQLAFLTASDRSALLRARGAR